MAWLSIIFAVGTLGFGLGNYVGRGAERTFARCYPDLFMAMLRRRDRA